MTDNTPAAECYLYKITRTRLVTEVFLVWGESEEDAFDTLGNADEGGDSFVEKVEDSTLQSDSEIELIA